jgi:serine/threonine protein kinase
LNHKSIEHRDLKPENILVEKLKNGFEIFKIIDFKNGKNNQEQNRRSTSLSGMTTPAYMAPEMII